MNASTSPPASPDPAGFLPFRTPVRGHAFAARPSQARGPHPSQRVLLAREPSNPADPLAIAVWVEDVDGPWRIGYLERAVAARLAPRLDTDRVAVAGEVEGWLEEPHGRWQRPVVALRPEDRGADHLDLAAEETPQWGRPARSIVRPVTPPREAAAAIRGSRTAPGTTAPTARAAAAG